MAITQQQPSPNACRYLGPNDEAFIGPPCSTYEATLALVKKHCPGIATVPDQQVIIQLGFEGAQPRAQNALFRILPEVWPAAVSDSLPIVYFSAAGRDQQSARNTMHVELVEDGHAGQAEKPVFGMPTAGTVPSRPTEGLTWDDLVKQGALLGIRGYSES